MGLDMYAYVANRPGQRDEFWEGAELDKDTKQFINSKISKPREIAYWRKHPNLHGWFANEWREQGNDGDFNGDELEITWDMLDRLEDAVINNELPSTQGFFFGNDADEYYQEEDLKFIREARAELVLGMKVFYNSSW